MRKIEFKILFQKSSCVDCILIFKFHEIVCLSVFVLELEIVWSLVRLLWSIPDLCYAKWARLQVRGCLKVALPGWESPAKLRLSHWFRKEETALDPLLPLHVFTSQLQRTVLQPQRNQVTLCTVPHFHQQCKRHTAITAAPSRLSVLVRTFPWVWEMEVWKLSHWGGVERNVSISWENELFKKKKTQ